MAASHVYGSIVLPLIEGQVLNYCELPVVPGVGSGPFSVSFPTSPHPIPLPESITPGMKLSSQTMLY
jgi:hypothetical protein